MKKRILSFLLVAMMLVTMLPVTVFATETEMSTEFKSLLNANGEFVINAVEPKTQEDLDFYLAEYIFIEHWIEYGDVYGFVETYDEETSTCDIYLNGEVHNVKIVFNYDKDVAAWMDEVASAFPEDIEHFYVKDMELFNYWLNKKGNDSDETGGNTLGNYSGELKAYLENKNVTIEIDNRAGGDDKFVTSRAGMAVLKHDGVAYYYNPAVGSKAEHAFYIPDNTGDTKEEIMAAIQSRFDEYAGEGKVEVVYGGEDIYEYLISAYDEEIARLTTEIAAAKVQVDAYDAQIAELEAKITALQQENVTYQETYNTNYNAKTDAENGITSCEEQIMALEMEIMSLENSLAEEESFQQEKWNEHDVIQEEMNAIGEQYGGDQSNPDYIEAMADAQSRLNAVLNEINDSTERYAAYDARRTEIREQEATLDTQKAAYVETIEQCQAAMDIAQNNINNNDNEIYNCNLELEQVRNQKNEYEFWTYNSLVEQKEREEAYKQGTIDSYESEDGEYYFLSKAAGDYWFDITIGEESYSFVAIKDSSKMITPIYASADVTTNVTVSSTDTSIPLDTMVTVDKLTSGTEYEKIIKILDVEENETFDITLWSGSAGTNITKLENGTFEVKIPVSDTLKGKDLVAYYVDENDKVVEYEVTVKDGYAVFETDHFSIYTIAEATDTNAGGNGGSTTVPPVGNGSNVPSTGDTTTFVVWMMLLAVGGAAVLYGVKRKNYN